MQTASRSNHPLKQLVLTVSQFHTPLTILADGSNSNFRSQFTSSKPKAQSRFWGLEIADAQLPIPRYAHSVLGRGPPIPMYPVSTHTTRILVDIPDSIFRDLGTSSAVRAYLQERVAPVIPEVLQPQLRLAIKSGRLRSMPSAWMPSTRNTMPGLIMVGDASNMRHPITGSGMTVAMKDAVLLASLLNPADIPHLSDSDAVLRAMRRFHWKRKAYSASLNILAQALYLLFVSEDRNLAIMQRGFVRYVREGKKRFAEPAWIMGGLTSNPLRLLYYLLFIAMHSIRLHLRQSSTLLGWILALGQSPGVFISALGILWGPLVDELR